MPLWRAAVAQDGPAPPGVGNGPIRPPRGANGATGGALSLLWRYGGRSPRPAIVGSVSLHDAAGAGRVRRPRAPVVGLAPQRRRQPMLAPDLRQVAVEVGIGGQRVGGQVSIL